MLSAEQYQQLYHMFDVWHSQKNYELEAIYHHLGYADYARLHKYYANRLSGITMTSLVIIDTTDAHDNYRVTLSGNMMEDFLKKFEYTPLDSRFWEYVYSLKSGPDVQIDLKKHSGSESIIIREYNLTIRLTQEEEGPVKPPEKHRVFFRHRNRTSFQWDQYRLDLTEVFQAASLKGLDHVQPKYELELEIIPTKSEKTKIDSMVTDFLDHVTSVLLKIQNSWSPVAYGEAQAVLNHYRRLLHVEKQGQLATRNAASLEVQHVVKFLSNGYAVVDKADGERHFLMVYQKVVYLIDQNLRVKKTKVTLAQETDIILDGELVRELDGRMQDEQGVYLAFDLVYADGVDYQYQKEYQLVHRLRKLREIVRKHFREIPFQEYLEKYRDLDLIKMRAYYEVQIDQYWRTFRQVYNEVEQYPMITQKVYYLPYGVDPSEIYLYATVIWQQYVYQSRAAYRLDGLIFTPMNTPYQIVYRVEDLDTIPVEYKWKPVDQNSIDFYIEFLRDEQGQEAIFYDYDVAHTVGNPYKICQLYVGLVHGREWKPVPFQVEYEDQLAKIYLQNGRALDQEGYILNDRTVVEFVYHAEEADPLVRWVPVRTRYDKTESVQRYHTRYGNSLPVARRIWHSIINPVTLDNLINLADPSSYNREYGLLESRLPGQFNQADPTRMVGMRAFHNWVKLNMISSYFSGRESVLDFGCGRGGDLHKMVHTGIKLYVGIDRDEYKLFYSNNSALQTYRKIQRKIPNIFPMYFIQANLRSPLTLEAQEKIYPLMKPKNKEYIRQFLENHTFSGINCQFNIHYYLSDEKTWQTFCQNICQHLDQYGYFLVTCFDGDLVHQELQKSPKMTLKYTNDNGLEEVFFEIIRAYNEPKNLGSAIDVFSIFENETKNISYQREYLVFPKFLVSSLRQNCGLVLVETDSFTNLFEIHRGFFQNNVPVEPIKLYQKVHQYYRSLEHDVAAQASFDLLRLNRYYIFRREDIRKDHEVRKNNKDVLLEPSRIIGINGRIRAEKVMLPYYGADLYIDKGIRSPLANRIYQRLRDHRDPSVYLLRHRVVREDIDRRTHYHHQFRILQLRKGRDPVYLIFYRSPEGLYYPVYYPNRKGHRQYYFTRGQKRLKLLATLTQMPK